MGILADKGITDDQIRGFFATNPTADQVAQQASSLGLSRDQLSGAMGVANYGGSTAAERDTNINNYTSQPNSSYTFGDAGVLTQRPTPTTNVPTMNGTAVGAGNFYGYNGKSYSTAALAPDATSFQASNGKTYTRQQINDWYNQIDPTTGQSNRNSYGADMRMQAELGLQAPDLYKARYLGGTSDQSTGIYTSASEMEPYGAYLNANRKNPNALSFFDWRKQQDPAYLASLARGATGNAGWTNGPAGGVPINYRAGDGAPGTPGVSGTPGIIGSVTPGNTGGAGSSSGSSSSTSTSNGGTVPWVVTPDQTVEGRVNGIINGNSGIIQQARTRALEQMNERGTANSSMATTASDAAAYQAAIPIAQADAATTSKAAGYNADIQNQFSTNSQNRSASMDQAQLSAATQKEVARLNAETSKTIAGLNNDAQARAQQFQLANATLLNTNQQAAQAYNTGMSAINNIQNNNQMDGNTKTQAIANVWHGVQMQMQVLERVSGLNLGSQLSFKAVDGKNYPGFNADGVWVGFNGSASTEPTTPTTPATTQPQTVDGGA